jgi:hypothetical protein
MYYVRLAKKKKHGKHKGKKEKSKGKKKAVTFYVVKNGKRKKVTFYARR